MVPRLSRRAAVAGVGLVGFILPFDLDRVVWSLDGHNIRPIHALVAVFLLGAFGAGRGSKTPAGGDLDPMFDRLTLALAVLLVLSTLFADQFQVVATVSLRRLLTGLALAMMVRRVVRTERDLRVVLTGVVAGACIACVLGFYILAAFPGPAFGELFRGRTVMFGPTQRFTLPFAHANVAGVYLGASLTLALGLFVDSLRRPMSNVWRTRALGVCSLILGIGLTLTLSRSALFATVVVLLVLVVATASVSWAGSAESASTNGRWIFGGALLLLIVAVAATPSWRARIANPGNAHWYQVEILAPDTIAPASAPESVLVRNLSEVSWSQSGVESELVAVSLDDKGEEIGRLLFPLPALAPSANDTPGGSEGVVLVNVSGLIAPEDTAAIVWDVFRPDQGHFRSLADQPVVVSSVPGRPLPAIIQPGRPFRPGVTGLDPVPSRTQLWSAARTLALERPLLGVGPGNFRLHYQEVLGVNGPQTTHAHSLLFEPLASWGIPATALFLFLILWVGLRAHSNLGEPMQLVVLAAFTLIVVANLADWTLASASGGLLFWLLFGLTARAESPSS